MSPSTSFDDLDALLQLWVKDLQEHLGPTLVGAYLQGSFAMGAGDEHSDVDFIVVVGDELTVEDVAKVQHIHTQIFNDDTFGRWHRHLEGSYVPKHILRELKDTSGSFWYLDNGARELVESDHCNSLVVRRTMRRFPFVLMGPCPTTLIPPVPDDLLRASIKRAMFGWARQIVRDPTPWANRFYQGFIVFTFCRVWRSLTLGDIGSKREAIVWAKERLPRDWHGLLDRAWDSRPDPATSARTPPDPIEFDRTVALVRLVLREFDEEV